MSALWPLLGAVGIALFVSGLPSVGRSRLRSRIEPWLGREQVRPGIGSRRGWRLLVPAALIERRGGRGLQGRLEAAGLAIGADDFRLEQIIWGAGSALVAMGGVAAVQTLSGGLDLTVLPLLGAIVLVSGYLGRDWWLSRQVERRQGVLRDELPAAIDLLTLSIMAGESVAAACARVAQALPGGIGSEFARVTADVRTGTPIVEALEGLSRRVPEVGVGRFVDALCVGIDKGAPLADTLRAQADDGREARRRRLLEAGGRREVLMLVPVVFLIMPVVVVFALYPGLVTLELLVP